MILYYIHASLASFNIATVFAIFQSQLRVKLYICGGTTILCLTSCKTRWCVISDPRDLFTFKLFSLAKIMVSENIKLLQKLLTDFGGSSSNELM